MQKSIQITGTGSYLPTRTVSNHELALQSGVRPEWVVEKLGIAERRFCSEQETTSDLAENAAKQAIKNAGVAYGQIDLIIVATASPDRQAPSTACILQRRLGIKNVAAFDVSAVCSGFVFALATAAQYLKSGACRRALVVGCDTFSRNTDFSRKDSVFFGDGAGAVVLEVTDEANGLFESELLSLGYGEDFFSIDHESHIFSMDGRAVFDAASQAVPTAIAKVLANAGVSADAVDIVVPHQPAIALLREIAHRAGIDFGRFVTNMDRYANTAGASIPIALHEAVEDGRLERGQTLLMASAGAGMTAGAVLMRW
jgi:3-oxoacyl-[acyl-carrier-protein] synthase-3